MISHLAASVLVVSLSFLLYWKNGTVFLSHLFEVQLDRSEMPGAWTVLVTGAGGFVGSHTVLSLLEADYNVVAIDNFHNAHKDKSSGMPESLCRVQSMAKKNLKFHDVDILDEEKLTKIFTTYKIDCVIHFAALKAVGESCQIPLKYYLTNVGGSCKLFQVMEKFNVKKLVYSSSATVYGLPQFLPFTESHPIGQGVTNPYGRTKVMVEEVMQDLSKSDGSWSFISLRYFNPVGAHESGNIGEDPQGIPNNLMPFISQVAVGRKPKLTIFGSDYNTSDGTGERDYIHIMDLADGHVKALKKLEESEGLGFKAYNLGTGEAHTVFQVLKAYEQASQKEIKYEMAPRRAGDIASSYADPSLAKKELNWVAKKSLLDMCTDSWRWQSENREGYNKV